MPDLLKTLDARDLWKGLDLNEFALYYQHVAQLSSAALNSCLVLYRKREGARREHEHGVFACFRYHDLPGKWSLTIALDTD